jgi:hypothetical protein
MRPASGEVSSELLSGGFEECLTTFSGAYNETEERPFCNIRGCLEREELKLGGKDAAALRTVHWSRWFRPFELSRRFARIPGFDKQSLNPPCQVSFWRLVRVVGRGLLDFERLFSETAISLRSDYRRSSSSRLGFLWAWSWHAAL